MQGTNLDCLSALTSRLSLNLIYSNLHLRLGRSQLPLGIDSVSTPHLAHSLSAWVARMQGLNLDCMSALTSRPSLKLSSNLHLRLCRSRLSLSVDSVSTPLLPFLHAL